MQILVTGGTGLIGSALIKLLVTQHNITVLSRNIDIASRKLGQNVCIITDLGEADFNQLDVVINLAGEPIADKRWTKRQKKKIEQSRWHITQQLVDRINAATAPPHTFISGSAIGYYGRQGDIVIDEQFQDCYPEFSHFLCERWEQIALQAASPETRVCLVRTGIVLSTKGGALRKMLPAFKLALGGPVASGNQVMSWVHLDDMVQILLYLLEHKSLSGPVNATAPNPVSNNLFSTVLANTLRRPHLFRVPAFVLKVLLGELSALLLYGQHVRPQKLIDSGFSYRHPDIQSALSNLLTKQ